MAPVKVFPDMIKLRALCTTRIWLQLSGGLLTLLMASSDVFAQNVRIKQREEFLRELSSRLLGKPAPVELGRDRGWRGVVLVASAYSIPDLQEVYVQRRTSRPHQIRLMQALQSLDRPLSVNAGIADFADGTVGRVWQDILDHIDLTSPTGGNPKDPLEVNKLNENLDLVHRTRSTEVLFSPRYLKYLAFQHKHEVVNQSENDGAWRFVHDLTGFGSSQEARAVLTDDWPYFGWEHEVSAIFHAFELRKHPAISGRQVMRDNNLVPEELSPLGKTWLFPPPDSWDDMGEWLNASSKTFDGRGTVSFKLARVRILRPWFSLEDLLDGRLQFEAEWLQRRDRCVLSDGSTPTLLSYPKGRLSVLPEELVLVRNTQFDRLGIDPDHPLNFSYPVINLVGFVVRALPDLCNTRGPRDQAH